MNSYCPDGNPHSWIVNPPPVQNGTCKLCGETRYFPMIADGVAWDIVNDEGQPYRRGRPRKVKNATDNAG